MINSYTLMPLMQGWYIKEWRLLRDNHINKEYGVMVGICFFVVFLWGLYMDGVVLLLYFLLYIKVVKWGWICNLRQLCWVLSRRWKINWEMISSYYLIFDVISQKLIKKIIHSPKSSKNPSHLSKNPTFNPKKIQDNPTPSTKITKTRSCK